MPRNGRVDGWNVKSCLLITRSGAVLDTVMLTCDISTFTADWNLIAQSRVLQMNEAFRAQHAFDASALWTLLAIIFVAMLIAASIYLFFQFRQRRARASNPQLLFQELCAAHSLSRSQRQALRRLAQVRGLTDPGLVFVDCSLWPNSVEANRLLGNRIRKSLTELRRLLFQAPGDSLSQPGK